MLAFSCKAVPMSCLHGILLNSDTVLVAASQIVHGLRVLLAHIVVEEKTATRIHLRTDAVLEASCQVQCRHHAALHRGQTKPADRLGWILLDSNAQEIAPADVALSVSVSTSSHLAKPLKGTSRIHFHFDAIVVTPRNTIHGYRVALGRSATIEQKRLGGVPLHSGALLVAESEIALRNHVTSFGGHAIQFDSGTRIHQHTTGRIVAPAQQLCDIHVPTEQRTKLCHGPFRFPGIACLTVESQVGHHSRC
mmetsp:Transcript_9282/g.28681  ORF Transcript_9282/g.28681 Transcript_9282/m.28681 type:complete len:250 (+) Transcript_9282:183-932(+)